MPLAVRKNCRRLRPWRRASVSPIAFVRASTSRWRADCGAGKYSSLETICVGIGPGNAAVSAGASASSSSALRNPMASSLGDLHDPRLDLLEALAHLRVVTRHDQLTGPR